MSFKLVSILTRLWRRVQLSMLRRTVARIGVSILTRPWGRVQRSSAEPTRWAS